jgi:hypothetical protein
MVKCRGKGHLRLPDLKEPKRKEKTPCPMLTGKALEF